MTCGHDDWVSERVADGHIAVIGHGCQKYTLRASKRDKEVQLGHAACEGDAPSLQEESIQHLGDGDRDIPDLQEGQATQEIVHGLMEGASDPDSEHDGKILYYHQQVNHKEEGEEQDLQPGGGGEAHQMNSLTRVMFLPSMTKSSERQEVITNNEGDYDIGEETSMLANQSS